MGVTVDSTQTYKFNFHNDSDIVLEIKCVIMTACPRM